MAKNIDAAIIDLLKKRAEIKKEVEGEEGKLQMYYSYFKGFSDAIEMIEEAAKAV